MDKENVVLITVEYSSVIRNRSISLVGKWMELMTTMLTEISQTQKVQ